MAANHLRILFVEDSEDDAQLVLRELERGGYEVEYERVETSQAMKAALAKQSWDLVLSDYSMPQFSAPDALAILQASGIDLPFIIASGTIGEDTAVAALKAGAHDFLIKNSLARLIAAIERELKDVEARRQRKRAEHALQSSKSKYRALAENTLQGIAIYQDQKMVYANPAMFDIFGYTVEELKSMSVEQLIGLTHPDDRAISQERARKRIAGEAVSPQVEVRILRKDGSTRWVQAFNSQIDYDGRSAILSTNIDITERKRAEETLRESDERFRSLFENTPVAIWEEDFTAVKAYLDDLENGQVTDLKKYLDDHPEVVARCARLVKVLDVNQESLRLFGAADKTELLAGLEKTFVPDSFDTFKRELLAMANNEHQMEIDVALQTLDGQRREARLNWALVPGHEKMYSRVLVSMVDITERKQRERELEAIASVSEALRTVKTLDEMLPRLLNEAIDLVDTDTGSIWLYDPTSDLISLETSRGWGDEKPAPLKRGQGIPGLVVQTGKAIIARELRSDPYLSEENRNIVPEGIGGACIPLHAAETVVGAMFINVRLPRELRTSELSVLNALAEIGGNAIHRMRLHDKSIKQVDRLSSLRTIDLAISGSLDLRISLNTVLEQVLSQLGVDAASVLLIQPVTDRLGYAAGRGFRTHAIASTSLRLGEDFAGQAAMDKKIVNIKHLAANGESFARRELLADEEFVSYFGVPLIAKGEVEGVLEIFNRSTLNVDMDWLDFLDSLSWQTAIAVDNALLFERIQRSNFDLALAYDATIEGWSRAFDLHDKETEGHTQRVTEMTLKLAQAMGFLEPELVQIRRGALLHDIGKMGVPDSILLKPDKLTQHEWKIMKQHPQLANELLQPIAYLQDALDIPYCHHEKWDGTGCPRGLSEAQIPLEARLFAIVDVWDAITSDRPYRKRWPRKKALKYIREESGKQFDPKVVEIFLREIIKE